MAGEAGVVSVAITATTNGLSQGLSEAVSALEGSVGKLGGLASKVGLAIGAGLAYSFYQYGQVEDATANLAVALRNAGDSSKDTLRDLTRYADGLEKVSRFQQDEIIHEQAALVMHGLTGVELKRATQAMVDLGAKTGSLSTASRILGNAFEGNAVGLKKFGLNIEEGTPKGLVYAAVIGEIESRMNGLAKAQSTTVLGDLDQMHKIFDDMAKTIGGRLSNAFKDTIGYLKDNREGLLNLADDIADKLVVMYNKLVDVVNFFNTHKTMFEWMMKGALAGGGIGLFAGGLGVIPGAIIGAGVGALGGDLWAEYQGRYDANKNEKPMSSLTLPHARKGWNDAGDNLPDAGPITGTAKGPTAWEKFRAGWDEAYRKVLGGASVLASGIERVMNGLVSALSSGFNGFFQGLILKGENVGQAFKHITDSLVQMMFKAFSDTLAQFIVKKALELTVHSATNAAKVGSDVAANTASVAATATATAAKIEMHVAEAEAGSMAAYSSIPWVGIAIGLASAAVIAGIIYSFKKFATGGIATGPTVGQFGEAGTEAIIPLESAHGKKMLSDAMAEAGGGGGGGDGFHLHLHAAMFEANAPAWERITRNVIIPALDRHGRKTSKTTGTVW